MFTTIYKYPTFHFFMIKISQLQTWYLVDAIILLLSLFLTTLQNNFYFEIYGMLRYW